MININSGDYDRIRVNITSDGFLKISLRKDYSCLKDFVSRASNDKLVTFYEPTLFYKCLLAVTEKSVAFLRDITVNVVKSLIAEHRLSEFEMATRIESILTISKEKIYRNLKIEDAESKVRRNAISNIKDLSAVYLYLGDNNKVYKTEEDGGIVYFNVNMGLDRAINQITSFLKSDKIDFFDLFLFDKTIMTSIMNDIFTKSKLYTDRIEFIRIIISSSQKEKQLSEVMRINSELSSNVSKFEEKVSRLKEMFKNNDITSLKIKELFEI